MANEELQVEMGMEGMPDLLSALLGEWTEAAPEVIGLLPVESLAPVLEEEPVLLLNIDALLNAWDEEKQDAVAEPALELVESLTPVPEEEPVSLLNIDALLNAWDEEKQEIVAEPAPEAKRELIKLARAIEEDRLPAKEDRATEVEAKYRYITFWMADEAYALPIAQVIESDKLAEVTPLPRVNEAIRGLIHLRGEILPMVDLRLMLGSKSNEVNERMLIVRTKNSSGACGLAVDRVSGLIAIRPHEVEQYVGSELRFVSGFCDRHGSRIGLLDLDRIFEGLSNPLAVREYDV